METRVSMAYALGLINSKMCECFESRSRYVDVFIFLLIIIRFFKVVLFGAAKKERFITQQPNV
jgi:hypothetical protein